MKVFDLRTKIDVDELIKELEGAMHGVFDSTVYPRIHVLIGLLKAPEPEPEEELEVDASS